MALDTLAKLIGAKQRPFAVHKDKGGDGGIGGVAVDLWTVGTSSVGVNPTVARRPDYQTLGNIFDDVPQAAAGKSLYFSGMEFRQVGQISKGLIFYDRLFDMGAFVGNVITVQNVDPTPTLPVNRGPGFDSLPGSAGEDAEIWLVEQSAVGANAATVVVNYVDDQGVARSSPSTLLDMNRNPGKVTMIPHATGAKGVRSVASLQVTTPTVSPGSFQVLIVRRLTALMVQARQPEGDALDATDWLRLGLVPLPPRACVSVALMEDPAQQASSPFQLFPKIIEV